MINILANQKNEKMKKQIPIKDESLNQEKQNNKEQPSNNQNRQKEENSTQKQQNKNTKQEHTHKKQQQTKEKQNQTKELKEQLSECKKQYEELKDKYLRLMAEYENYRKRTLKEKMELVKTAGENVIKGLLEIIDNFERALASIENTNDIKAIKDGVNLIYKGLKDYLKQQGLQEIEALGKPLDTDLHEAVGQKPVEDEQQKGKVVEVMQKGYLLNGKVIRHAKVIIGS